MKRFVFALAVLSLSACSSNPKNPEASRNPAAWSEQVQGLELKKHPSEIKITFQQGFIMDLILRDTPLPISDEILEGLRYPYPNQSLQTDYIALFQNGRRLNFPPERANTPLDSMCGVTSTNFAKFNVKKVPKEVRAHFEMNGGWTEELTRFFEVPVQIHMIEMPRKMTVHRLEARPTLFAGESLDNLSFIPREEEAETGRFFKNWKMFFSKSPKNSGFVLSGVVQIAKSTALIPISIQCYLSAGDHYALQGGNWAALLERAMGDYITVENLELAPFDPTKESPYVPAIKIRYNGPPPKEVKTREI